MIRLAMLCYAMLFLTLPAFGQEVTAKLVPSAERREINIESGFTGTDLLLFGAIIHPRGLQAEDKVDIAVVLRAPSQALRLREKRRVLGIWVNADAQEFLSVPGYYGIAASRPIKDIVDSRTADIYELGVNRLQLSPGNNTDRATARRFATGLVDLRGRGQLFKQSGNVTITDGVLYQARLQIPSSVPTGRYIAETMLIHNGEVIQVDDSVEIEVRKVGFEALITRLADQYGLFYGLFAVLVSLGFGWVAAVIFRHM